MLDKKILISLGFKQIKHLFLEIFTLEIGRNRELSLHCLGTGNEMLFISEISNEKEITDTVVLHNFDYDGFLTEEKLLLLIQFLNYKK